MQSSSPRWVSIFILTIVVTGAALIWLAAFGMGALSIITLLVDGSDAASSMILSLAFAFQGILLAAVAWPILQKVNGQPKADESFRLPFAGWHVLVAAGMTLAALLLGGLITYRDVQLLSWFALPPLTILAVAPPIWILLAAGANQLDLGPRWRAFGIFGIAATIGPLIMIFLEIALALVGIVVFSMFIAGQPARADGILQLAAMLENETDPETILNVLGPYIFNPAVIGTIMAYIAVAVPMIEELLKPLGIWLFMRKIERPAQGFALGLLSGAAYALFESLGASGQGGQAWPTVVAARAGTSLLHIFTTGLMGWAIVSAVRERRYLRLPAAYAAAVLLHGVWNASAVATSLAGASDLIMATSFSPTLLPAMVGGLLVLGAGMLFLLIVFNRRLRKLSEPAPLLEPEPTAQTPGDGQGVQ